MFLKITAKPRKSQYQHLHHHDEPQRASRHPLKFSGRSVLKSIPDEKSYNISSGPFHPNKIKPNQLSTRIPQEKTIKIPKNTFEMKPQKDGIANKNELFFAFPDKNADSLRLFLEKHRTLVQEAVKCNSRSKSGHLPLEQEIDVLSKKFRPTSRSKRKENLKYSNHQPSSKHNIERSSRKTVQRCEEKTNVFPFALPRRPPKLQCFAEKNQLEASNPDVYPAKLKKKLDHKVNEKPVQNVVCIENGFAFDESAKPKHSFQQTNNNVQKENLHPKTKKLPTKKAKTFSQLYQVQDIIGIGGGGKVYAGTRIADNQPVAVKKILREKVKRWENIKQRPIPQEIALMMRVNKHDGVIKLLDWTETNDSYILVLERPKNSIDLFDYARKQGKMNEREAKKIFKQIVMAVEYIHSRGVLHRDIKDENIVMNRETGQIKVIDFGCGTMLHNGYYKDFAGTPEYYPPEWFNKNRYQGEEAAVWSLGVLLYSLVCGEIPFQSASMVKKGKVMFKSPPSAGARHLISMLLSFNPADRPSVSEILEHPWLRGIKI